MEARRRWNERYGREGALQPFPDAPASWLVEHRELLAASGGGRALDVGCGDGRNALYLARHGYAVEAIDISDVLVAALTEEAERRALAITPRIVDLEREPLPAGPFDAIVTMHFLQRDLFAAMQDALAPDGLLFYETLSTAHVQQLGHSFNPDYLLEPGELLRAFPLLEVVDHREGIVGPTGRERGVASIVARRPG